MRTILLTLLITIPNIQINQEKPIENWINEIVNEMIEMNDLRKYSNFEIPSDTKVDFIMVESVKNIKIDNGIITMLVNHGTGKYCTELKFKYVENEGEYYLVFGIMTTIAYGGGIEEKSIKPWIEKNKICE